MVVTPTIDDIVHDGVSYARAVFRACFDNSHSPDYTPQYLDTEQMEELHQLACQMALAMDQQCMSTYRHLLE